MILPRWSNKQISQHGICENVTLSSSLFEAVFLPLIEQISFCTAQVDNLRASISVFLLNCTLLAVICITDSRPTADNTTPLVGAIIAFIADTNQGAGSHIGITDYTFSITLLTETANSNARLFSTEDEIRVMFRHLLEVKMMMQIENN